MPRIGVIGRWLDAWGPRLSNIAQVGLCVAAVWGLIYTIVPLYRLAVLDDEIARKTLELRKANAALSQAYVEAQREAIRSLVLATTVDCTGLLLPPRVLSTHPRAPVWKELLKIDVGSCVEQMMDRNHWIPQLNNADQIFLRAQVDGALKDIALLKADALATCRSLETAPIESIPEIPPPAPGSVLAQLKDAVQAMEGRGVDLKLTAEQRREHAQDHVADEFGKRARERLHELEKIRWPPRASD